MSRPLCLVIENKYDTETPGGIPTVTCIRKMTWLEYLCYRVKTKRGKPNDELFIKSRTAPELTIGVEISREQYVKLLQGDNDGVLKEIGYPSSIQLNLLPAEALSELDVEEELSV